MTARPPDPAPKGLPDTPAEATDPAPAPGEAGPERRRGADRRAGKDRRQRNIPVANDRRSGIDRRAIADRRALQRGGQYELDADTLEFIRAIDAFKEHTGKTFPTWSELLGILKDLGYEKSQ